MLIPAGSTLGTNTSPSTSSGASAKVVNANSQRNGLSVAVDTAATGPVYLLLWDGITGSQPVASATNFHFALPAGGSWDGLVSGTLWLGAVITFSAAAQHLGIVEL